MVASVVTISEDVNLTVIADKYQLLKFHQE